MMRKILLIPLFLMALLFAFCQSKNNDGSLLIIGGGRVNEAMRDQMIKTTKLDQKGYMVILPMASEEEPLINAQEVMDVFSDFPQVKIFTFNIQKGDEIAPSRIDSIRNASLIFITGGDQCRFLDIIYGTGIKEAIFEAYHNGALIAGTSAGASLMSKVMVTGNELQHPDDGSFTCIQANNAETIEGLGFLDKVIIDQHFIVRKRQNRMLSYSAEHPGYTCIGIDESTAIFVKDNTATVFGISQVIVLRNNNAECTIQNGLLGIKGLTLDVFLPGERFNLLLNK